MIFRILVNEGTTSRWLRINAYDWQTLNGLLAPGRTVVLMTGDVWIVSQEHILTIARDFAAEAEDGE